MIIELYIKWVMSVFGYERMSKCGVKSKSKNKIVREIRCCILKFLINQIQKLQPEYKCPLALPVVIGSHIIDA